MWFTHCLVWVGLGSISSLDEMCGWFNVNLHWDLFGFGVWQALNYLLDEHLSGGCAVISIKSCWISIQLCSLTILGVVVLLAYQTES